MTRTLLWPLIFVLALWHGWLFLIGYRITGDDVFFLESYLKGPAHLWEMTQGMARGHGRIGFHGLMPLNMWTSYAAGFLEWRVVFIGLYMGTAALMFVYAATLIQRPIAPLAFLIWLCLHPLGFDHMPPTAYPMQNTLPMLILIALRLAALHWGERGVWSLMGRILQILMMVMTEFAALLGFAMIAAESFVRHPSVLRRGWLRAVFADRATGRDILTVVLVLGPYVLYRLANPSTYTGNQIDGAGAVEAVAIVTVRHVLEGLVPFRVEPLVQLPPLWFLIGTGVAALGMAVALFAVLRRPATAVRFWSATLFLIGAMLLVTLPLTMTTKQHEFCLVHQSCAYLDSRVSIFGVVLILALAVARWQPVVLRLGVACAGAALFALGSVMNWQVTQEMRSYAEVWQRADALACHPDLVPEEPKYLTALIDPRDRVKLVYSDTIKDTFWPLYLSKASEWSDCTDDPVITAAVERSYLPLLTLGAGVTGDFRKFLGQGWSDVEPTGVWSIGQQADLRFFTEGLNARQNATLTLHGRVFSEAGLPAQTVIATQDGAALFKALIHPGEIINIPLPPHDPDLKEIVITLQFPDARTPQTITDPRQMGWFLQGLSLQ